MPGGDRTGPSGMGPMTGRAAGICAGNQGINPRWGQGFGGGRGGRGGNAWGGGGGGGRQNRYRFNAPGPGFWQNQTMPPFQGTPTPTMSRSQEMAALKNQVAYFENILADLKNRIEAVDSSQEDS